MAACASCGTPGIDPDRACPRCGAAPASGPGAMPDLELDVRARPPPRPPKPKRKAEEDAPLELAVDPRALVQERAFEGHGPAPPVNVHSAAAASAQVLRAPANVWGHGGRFPAPTTLAHAPQQGVPAVGDLEFDARVLAEYGDPPTSWVLAPFYAWRVLKRQRELKTALAGRRAEAALAGTELEDALVAFTERVRAVAEKQPAYATALEELKRAEDLLRSRDQVLAAEQDAQTARLAQVDARLAKGEAELAQALADERSLNGELSSAQGALGRVEAKLKRAEIELRSAQQREASGKAGP